ncbi:cyclin N-terminal domain containing 1 [Chamberlinius hualienensis]
MVENTKDELNFGSENVDFILDVLEDHLNYLGDEVEKLKQSTYEKDCLTGRFVSKFHVMCINRLCKLLNQSPPVKFHAIELFDAFMRKHIPDFLNITKTNYKDAWLSTWRLVQKRIASQMILRMLSCIQIASKIRNQETSSVKIADVLFVLRTNNLSFTKDSVIFSEIRVLQTVKFAINQKTPLDYLETLLEVLVRNDPCINASKLYSLSLKVLDIACYDRKELYMKLYERLSGNREPMSRKESQRWKSNEVDFIFLASVIISSSAYLLNPCSYVRLINELQKIVKIPLDDIMDFTIVFIDYILERSNIEVEREKND